MAGIDSTSGSGSLLITIGRSAARYMGSGSHIKYYAQELKENTYNLTRMNLVMRGILPDNIVTRNGDTLEEDWPFFEDNDPAGTYEPLYVDAVVSNPPYSQAWNPSEKENDLRYAKYGLAPKGKADYAFLLHDLYHIKPDGIMTIVLPHGVLFRGGEEGTIRKNLVERNNIDTIIGLPANIFFGTGIPTIIMVLKQNRPNTDVLVIDASKGFEKVGTNNVLRACDIKKIVDVVISRTSVPKFSKVVTRDEIRANDYNLNIPRYVDSSEKAESWDIYASMFGGIPESELAELEEYWAAFPTLKEALFRPVNTHYYEKTGSDLKAIIENHPDVNHFLETYAEAFRDFPDYLSGRLLANRQEIPIAGAETELADHIFRRLSDIPLVDRYHAYQILDDAWKDISIDLEILQTEGPQAARQVDPNMVLKKKKNVEEEVQEGWLGHILPFVLVQKNFLTEETTTISGMESRLQEIGEAYTDLLEELGEEDKEQDFVKEDAFVFAEVKKALKAKTLEPETLAVLKKVTQLNTEEKEMKKKIKTASEELHLKTKETIENLDDTQVEDLLVQKWIRPLTEDLLALPRTVIDDLTKKLETLCSKYDTTYAEVETQIAETEKTLTCLIDELTGSDYDRKGLEELKTLLGGK